MQSEEDRKNILILQESLDKLNEKIKMYKRLFRGLSKNLIQKIFLRIIKYLKTKDFLESNRKTFMSPSGGKYKSILADTQI